MFSMPSYPIPTPQQSSPYAGLLQSMIDSYTSMQKAKYTPQMIQANIFGKEFTPLAQLATSRLAYAMMPTQQQQMAQMITRLMGQVAPISGMGITSGAGSATGISGSPQGTSITASGGDGTLGSSGGMAVGGAGEVGGSATQNTPGLPSHDLSTAIRQTTMSPYSRQLNPAGSTYTTGEGDFSTPTEKTTTQAQDTLSTVATLKKMLPDYLKQAKEFTTPQGSELSRIASSAAAMANKHGYTELGAKFSDDPDLAGRWNNFQAERDRLGVLLQHIYPTSSALESYKKHIAMLDLSSDDTYGAFAKRIKQVMDDLDTATVNAKQAANAGTSYNLNPESKTIYGPEKTASSDTMQSQGQPTNILSAGAKRLSKSLQLPPFGSKKEFQDWFRNQPSMVQHAVRAQLAGA